MIRKSIKEQIKNYFFENPTAKLRVRQTERILKLPLPSVINYTKELTKESFLKKTEIAGITLFSADRGSANYLLEKRFFNIKQIYDSGLMDYLIKECNNPTIILFGSFSRGEDVEDSDIDIYIETSKEIKNLNQFEQKLNHHLQLFKHKNLNEIQNKELANNIINGIKLNGFLEVFR